MDAFGGRDGRPTDGAFGGSWRTGVTERATLPHAAPALSLSSDSLLVSR